MWARRITSSWTESGVKWSNHPTRTSTSESDACAESASISCFIPVTYWTRTYVSGTNTNYGFWLDTDDHNYTYWKRLIASEEGGSTTPRLYVTYHEPVTATAPIDNVLTASRTLGWTFDSATTGSTQGAYQVQVSADGFATVAADSGAQTGAATSWAIPDATPLVSGTPYSWRVRVKIGTAGTWSGWANGSFTWNGDTTPPVLTAGNRSASPTGDPGLSFAITGSEDLACGSITADDFALTEAGFVGSNGTGTACTVELSSTITAGTTGTSSVAAAGAFSVTDLAGNPATTITGLPLSWTVDRGGPTSTTFDLQAGSDSGVSQTDRITNADELVFDLGFSEPVTGLAQSDFSVSGVIGCSITPAGSGATYTVTLTGCPAGTLTLTLAANAVTDAAGNHGPAAAASAPPVTIDATILSATFSEPATGSTVVTSESPYVVQWFAPADPSGITSQQVSVRTAPPTGDSCDGVEWASWSTDQDATSPYQANLESGRCHQWRVRVTDGAGNASETLSGTVRHNAEAWAPDILLEPGPGVRQDAANDTIWVHPLAGLPLSVTAGVAGAPGTVTGVTWDLSDETGWTGSPPLPAVDTTPPFGQGLVVGEDAVPTVLTATASMGGGASAERNVPIEIDRDGPVLLFSSPADERQSAGTVSVAWTEADAGSGIGTRALRRERRPAGPDGLCIGFDWVQDGAATADPSPVVVTDLAEGFCYRWILAVIDRVGNSTVRTSPPVGIDATGPTLAIESPATGTEQLHGSDSVEIAWSDADNGSAVAERSIQRWRADMSNGVCEGSWTADGDPVVADSSPVVSRDLTPSTCYRFELVATDGAGNVSSAESGTVRTEDTILTSPADGDSIFATEDLEAVTTLTGVTSIEFLLDGYIIATDTTTPYEAVLDTVPLEDGSHELSLVVWTGATSAATALVEVLVDNALSPESRIDEDWRTGRITLDERVVDLIYAFSTSAWRRWSASSSRCPLPVGDEGVEVVES